MFLSPWRPFILPTAECKGIPDGPHVHNPAIVISSPAAEGLDLAFDQINRGIASTRRILPVVGPPAAFCVETSAEVTSSRVLESAGSTVVPSH